MEITNAINAPNILCPSLVSKGKFHPTIHYTYAKGKGMFVTGGCQLATYRIDVYQYDAQTGQSCWLECETKQEESAIYRSFVRLWKKYANGMPIKGRPKKN